MAGACQGLLETRDIAAISLVALLTQFAPGAQRFVAASDADQAQLLRTAMDAFVNNTAELSRAGQGRRSQGHDAARRRSCRRQSPKPLTDNRSVGGNSMGPGAVGGEHRQLRAACSPRFDCRSGGSVFPDETAWLIFPRWSQAVMPTVVSSCCRLGVGRGPLFLTPRDPALTPRFSDGADRLSADSGPARQAMVYSKTIGNLSRSPISSATGVVGQTSTVFHCESPES